VPKRKDTAEVLDTGGKTFSVKMRDGTFEELPARQCDDWRPGQPDGDRWRPDFSQIPKCPRCRGHADKDGWHRGGHIPVLAWELDFAWYTRIAACSCVFGAWLAGTAKLKFYDDSERALPGLGYEDIRRLETTLRGHRGDPDGLRKAADSIILSDARERILRAVDQREIREQHAPELAPRPAGWRGR
jgi:hypothetical protein